MRSTTIRHALLSLCNAGLIMACDDGDVSPSRALTSAGASQALSPSVEAAGAATRLRFERDVVQASFSNQTPECGTVVDVFATAGVEHITHGLTNGGAPQRINASVALQVTVSCDPEPPEPRSIVAGGTAVLTVKGDLGAAHLQGTLTGFDEGSGEEVPVTVDLAWEGGSMIDSHTDKTRSKPGGVVSRSTTRNRGAEATGTVVSGAVNFTPDPSLFGQISKDHGYFILEEP
jgi:hypothetical protein